MNLAKHESTYTKTFQNIFTTEHMFFLNMIQNVVYSKLKLQGQPSYGAGFIFWRGQAMSTICSHPGLVPK